MRKIKMEMLGTALVGLRDTDQPKEQPLAQGKAVLYVKVDPDLKSYADARGRALDGGYTEFVVDAIKLDKDLEERLAEQTERLKAYAHTRGMSTKTQLGAVISELVTKALDCVEAGDDCAKPKPNGHKPTKK